MTNYRDESLLGTNASALHLIVELEACVYNLLVQLMKLDKYCYVL